MWEKYIKLGIELGNQDRRNLTPLDLHLHINFFNFSLKKLKNLHIVILI